jgi:hypothetical protein
MLDSEVLVCFFVLCYLLNSSLGGAKKMLLAARAASLARVIVPSRLVYASLFRNAPLFFDLLRQPPIHSPTTTPQAFAAPSNKSKFVGLPVDAPC